MANPGGATKFASVNLNKSYGQNNQASFGSNRTRPIAHGGGGGSMVVLSRPRSSHKATGPKLSVPPPLNLPSLRKEHERFDSLGSAGGATGGTGSGVGSRTATSGAGWTKAATVALQEKEPFSETAAVDGIDRGSSVYVPPSARSGVVGPSVPVPPPVVVEKAAVLRGEDFPSLRATLASASGMAHKAKENLNQNQTEQFGGEGLLRGQKGDSGLSSHLNVNSQFKVSGGGVGSGVSENGNVGRSGSSGPRGIDQGRKQGEYFPGPLPLVRLNPRSDWADDERDTSHGLMDRSREGKDHAFSKSETYWDRDFDMPRVSVLPHKPAHNFEKRGQWDNEAGKVSSGEVSKVDPYARKYSREEREGNSWRSSFSKDGFGVQDAGNERNGFAGHASGMNQEVGKDNKYVASPFRDKVYDDPGKRDTGYDQGGNHPWKNAMESYGSRGPERNTRDGYAGNDQQHNRNRGFSVQNSLSKFSFSLGGKGLPLNDPLLNFGREKRHVRVEKAFLDDPFTKDFGASGFDGRDLLSAGLVGVVKKKKDVSKQTNFHDPVRESFEAELERVQMMQEQERQQIIEEQERTLELARRKEEERLRQAREEGERQRRLEEEAREAAWRAEQERIDALRKAEEQRLAREEEKQRLLLEEERRKQAAKQKLLELEQKIARRQAEATRDGVGDEKISALVKEKDSSRSAYVGDWDDSERMVERIITSASSDSSSVNRPLEIGTRAHFSRDITSPFIDGGKPVNSWKRDAYDNGNSSALYLLDQDNGLHSNGPRRDSSIIGKPFMRRDHYGGAGFMSSRTYYKGVSDSHLDEYAHVKGQRWNQSRDGDHFIRNTETDSYFRENFVERFGDGWAQSCPRGNPIPPFSERTYQNSESYSLGRSRYSVRQPRVLPPPILAPVQKTCRNENEDPVPSAFIENALRYDQVTRGESSMPTGYDNKACEQEAADALQETAENKDHGVETTHRCDSQSSLSVSSPPSSPTHLSHDDLDGTGDSYVILASEEAKNGTLSASESESITLSSRAKNENTATSSHDVSAADDENEWVAENNEQFQEQEVYDEEEDYQEEDEVHEVDDNIDLNQEFENMHLEEKGLPHMMDNLILGFDDGVQVGMPNEEFERTSNGQEATYLPQQTSINKLEEHVSFDKECNDGKALLPVDDPYNVNHNTSSMVQEQEKPTPDLVIQSSDAHSSLASDSLGNMENASGMSTHHTVPTLGTIAPHSSFGQNAMPSVAATPSQAELPVKLQFGLFSGPSLIPSPVPAIQIGSIQMPLHLGPSISHMFPSRAPLFQFGQLRYTSPISQGIMPLGPQSMSFVQPNIPSDFSFNLNPGGQLPHCTVPGTSDELSKNEVKPHSVENQPGNSRQLSQCSLSIKSAENIKQDHIDLSSTGNNIIRTVTGIQVDKKGSQNLVGKGSRASPNSNESDGHPLTRDASLHSVSKEKDAIYAKAQFPVTGGRGKKYVFMAKTPGSRSSGPVPRAHPPDSRGFLRRPRRNIQHTEFRVRDSAETRQTSNLVLTDQVGSDNKSNFNGRGTVMPGRNGPRKILANKLGKQAAESGIENSQQMNSGNVADKVDGKDSAKTQTISHSGHSILKRNLCSEDDGDAPLQSGIICVFEQPGIEAPSDEDDFIEVRSKRKMLHDRREQREKEIKAKSQVAKMPRKPRSTMQNAVSTGEVANGARAHLVVAEGHGMSKIDVTTGINSSVSPQPLAPIGTPPLKIDSQSDLRSQTSRTVQVSLQAVAGGGKGTGSGVLFETKNKVDDVQTALGSWGHVPINQQVMALTQTQLDDAMNPQQFDSRASIGDLTSPVDEFNLPTSSILPKEKSFSSSSPINSLLAGEKIQFGAVTSPTVLPSSVRCVSHSHGIGPPGSSRSDVKFSHNLPGSGNDCCIFFDKEKQSNESRSHLEDCEAEAEAAASAVAVAAISSDEIVGNGSSTHSVSVSDAKNFVAADIGSREAGISSEQQSAIQSRSEEHLSVSLPADLSVETPSIPLWSPLPNQQNSPGQLISHFPPGPPHFPCYEMNPMMGGAVFTFGPHDESASTAQSQPQKSAPTAAGAIGGWHQCHPGVDSFYGPPTGFTGPFITPPGGIPGIQGPPHMVVYNHFAPVGQYGQVGMSFMGTYIPSGKQPDWKHNPTSSASAVEGDVNMNAASSHRNPAANMPSPIQHLAPGSPLVPMASPLPMFDVSPFQKQGVNASQYCQGSSADRQLNVNRFPGSQTSTSDVNVNLLPAEFGLPDHSDTGAVKASTQSLVNKTSSNAAKADVYNGDINNSNNHNESSASKIQISQQNSSSYQQHDHSSGYTNYKRGGNVSQRNSSSRGEWSHRRMGFQVRNQSAGADKNYPSSKVKQIYVAKQSTGRSSTVS